MSVAKYSLVFPMDIHNGFIILGYQQSGLWRNRFNGFGGKQEEKDVDIHHTAKRELFEESGIDADTLIHTGVIDFRHLQNEWPAKQVFVYLHDLDITEFNKINSPRNLTLIPFKLANFPWHEMPPGDQYWLNYIFTRYEFLKGSVLISSSKKYKGDYIKKVTIEFSDGKDRDKIFFTNESK